MSKTIFISKNHSELEKLSKFASTNGFELFSHSFLKFSEISFSITYPYDVIFFGSPRAVMFFKAQYEIPKDKLIACVGGKTESLLKSLGCHVAFSGSNLGNIVEVAEKFQDWLGEKSVLFPVSNKSLGTISDKIPSKQKQVVTCYETHLHSKSIESCDIYVFTSPSNVEGFLLTNKVPPTSFIIAWGNSTNSKLNSEGLSSDAILAEPTMDGLLDIFQKI